MIQKYPRTQHLRGSRIQKGDEDLELVSLENLKNARLVLEEKVDGSNTGVSFENGELHLQSRGHYLRGGPRERQYDVFKQWAACHEDAFRNSLGDRYIMYGEWLYAKHTCFYDALPHYFMEFDLYDKQETRWLSTDARRRHYAETGIDGLIYPVRVLHEVVGGNITVASLKALIGPSAFKTPQWRDRLATLASDMGQDPATVTAHTDPLTEMEGIYIKSEDENCVLGRYKFVRESFTNAILDQGIHWSKRVIIPNQLVQGAYERMFTQNEQNA